MVKQLPRNIQLRLDQTLAQWASWRCEPALTRKPKALRQLSPGLSNYSILVEEEKPYVVRIDGTNPAVVGLSRQTEWRVLHAASNAGLAPCPRYHNPDLGSLVYDFLPEDDNGKTGPVETAELLRQIHRLPAVHFRLDLNERIIRYRKHIEHRGRTIYPQLAACQDRVQTIIDVVNCQNRNLVLCHNDLLQANRLPSGGRLQALDWEYCAMGSPWFDLAVVIVGDAFPPDETELLLSTYLGRKAEPDERLELSQHECLYRYIELLWFSALDDAAERARYPFDSNIAALLNCLDECA